MKKLAMLLMLLMAVSMGGHHVFSQSVTITLMPGWNWISCPMMDTLDFETAMGSFTPVSGDIIKSRWGQAIYNGNRWMGTISQFYPGYGYMYKSNRTMPVMVTFNAQLPTPQVQVTTSEPMLITAVSAMGGGEVTTTDGTYIIVKGLCWATHENPTTNDDFFEEAESGVGSFSISMTGLNISTTYYVRAYAVTANGTVYGDEKTFTTRDGIPTVTTDTVTSITGATATCGGTVTDNGGLNVTARGVCWSTSHNPTVSDSHTTNGSGLGSFTSSITGMSISTTYYVRAYASTSQGTAYGEEVSFTTRDGIPTVTTAEVTDIQGETATCGGTVTDNCGLTITARGVCWSISPDPSLDDSYTNNGEGDGSFSSSIIGLSLSTTYYVRAYATTSAGTGYGEQVSFTTRNGIPTVTTADVTDILGDGATGGGNVTDNGGLDVVSRGICWSTSPNPTLADSHTESGSGTGSFSCSITDLSANTTYYLRAYATNSFVTVYGNEKTFTTLDGIPTLMTVEVTNIQGATATCGGNITDNGGLNVVARGVCWSTSPNPTVDDPHTTNGSGMGNYSSSITGLSVSTTYYVRAYATTTAGTGYGEQKTFTTLDGIPVVTTAPVTNIMVIRATCGGVVTDNGGLNVIARGVCWSTFPNPTVNECHTTNGSGLGDFSSSITGLLAGTTYYVRAYATTNHITTYGEEVTFTTWDSSVGNNPLGSISGLFSISDTQLVYFSQGNLQYIGSAGTPYWKFAENQWDKLGTTTGQNSSNQDVNRDLFCWGTSGWNSGNTYYEPWDTDKSDGRLYGPYGIYGLTGAYANSDWGVYNAISNGGNLPNQWRTLTSSEWSYVFSTRMTASGLRFAKANVNGINGIILLPDDWNTSYYTLNNTNSGTANYSNNIITALQWNTIEQYGAVFLPAAGNRDGTSVGSTNNGYYWSATCGGSEGARLVYFSGSTLYSNDGITRCVGLSVRLVCPVEN